MTNTCPKCTSNDWDHANVGLIGAIVCTNCGEIYMMEEQETIEEQPCPMCGCVDWGWINCEVAGIETSAKICEECGHVYGGDLE